MTTVFMFFCMGWGASPVIALDTRLQADEQQRVEMIAKAKPTVVAIFGPGGSGGGSGVLISRDGYALSNFHVTQGAGPALKCGLNNGQLYDAVLVGIDPVGDVALVKLLGRDDFPAAPMGNSDRLNVGEPVYAMGNPFLLATDFEPTVTAGIVSGLHRYQPPAGTLLEYTDCIQTDASINPGNSGGPLFNSRGEIVGINGRGSFEKRGRVNVGVAYAISINQIKHFLHHLRGGLIIDHATLGATVSTSDDGRVYIQQILSSSDAYQKGLRAGDELLTFGNRSITSVNQFKNVLGIFPKGWKVELTYRRANERTTIYPRLQGVHRAGELLKPKSPPPAPKKPSQTPTKPPVKPAPIPDAVKAVYEKKEGFANYYFNKAQRDPLLAGIRALGDFQPVSGKWEFTFVTANQQKVVVKLLDEQVSWQSGNHAFLYKPGHDENVDPPGTGGLLVALDHWRCMVLDLDKWFIPCDFAGGFPDSRGNILLGIQAKRGGRESYWMFDQHYKLRRLECLVDESMGPIDLEFDNYRPVDGRQLPHLWIVSHQGKEVMRLTLEKAVLHAP